MTFELVRTAAYIAFVSLLWQACAAPIDEYFVVVEEKVSSRPSTDNKVLVRNTVPYQQSNIFMKGVIDIPSFINANTQINAITQEAMDNTNNIASTLNGFSHHDLEVIFFCLVSVVVLSLVFMVLFARLKQECRGLNKFSCSSRQSSRSMTKGISDFATDPFSLAPVYAKITVVATPLAAAGEYHENEDCVEIIEEDLEFTV